jgi:hypothetical protein
VKFGLLIACIALSGIAWSAIESAHVSSARRTPARDARPITRVHVEIPRRSFDEYVAFAADVVHARVVSVTGVSQTPAVDVTQVEIDVLSSLHGRVEGRTVVVVAGADLPSRRTIVSAAPSFVVGEEVVLFLSSGSTGSAHHILGLGQGTYRVRENPLRGYEVVGLHANGELLEDFLARAGEAADRVAVEGR